MIFLLEVPKILVPTKSFAKSTFSNFVFLPASLILVDIQMNLINSKQCPRLRDFRNVVQNFGVLQLVDILIVNPRCDNERSLEFEFFGRVASYGGASVGVEANLAVLIDPHS